jgi:signal peptidase I
MRPDDPIALQQAAAAHRDGALAKPPATLPDAVEETSIRSTDPDEVISETESDVEPISLDVAPTGHRRRRRKRSALHNTIEWVIVLGAALVVALVVKTWLFQAFYIPSASMVPTLEIGDRVLVNKLSYDLHEVNRGDIVVFSAGPNEQWQKAGIDDLVKRVIALPGETISECQTGRVCIDDRLLEESYLPDGTTTNISGEIPGCDESSPPDGCTVPAGSFFVMGDNRSQSADGRIHGPIKGSSIVGRVFVRIWPLDRLGFL